MINYETIVKSENRTFIMGILNCTPDSFSDGGRYFDSELAVERALQMISDGADIIDIGGESTRPGSDPVTIEEELARVIPVISQLRAESDIAISVDTMKPEVALKAIEAGANIINDVSGLRDPNMVEVAAHANVPVVIMHMQGEPKTMHLSPEYNDVVDDVKSYLSRQIEMATTNGISKIIIDPGIGFGKNIDHNLAIIKRLGEFNELGYPILFGASRKGFLGKLTGGLEVNQREEATIAVNCAAILSGAKIIRVHDVLKNKRAAMVMDALR